jgi:hypothetical protein
MTHEWTLADYFALPFMALFTLAVYWLKGKYRRRACRNPETDGYFPNEMLNRT